MAASVVQQIRYLTCLLVLSLGVCIRKQSDDSSGFKDQFDTLIREVSEHLSRKISGSSFTDLSEAATTEAQERQASQKNSEPIVAVFIGVGLSVAMVIFLFILWLDPFSCTAPSTSNEVASSIGDVGRNGEAASSGNTGARRHSVGGHDREPDELTRGAGDELRKSFERLHSGASHHAGEESPDVKKVKSESPQQKSGGAGRRVSKLETM
eukprot:TRINITY_DN65837_c0_g1_i1.p1 TRINITY_DN65837_c0_g1~~TRINITY_DN65837_c0_g1_i1.p1  ORF type:complete len:221 (+),score=33.02 TRINITY_DN65837_c0_g1_i1:35-664(+)